MGIKNTKRTIILLLTIGILVLTVVSGCVRWPTPDPPVPPDPEYQLKVTVEVAGEINSDEGIYYIVLDADEDPADGPGSDIFFWDDDWYYINLESYFFYFAKVEEGSPELQLTDSSYSVNKLEVTVALIDLEDPSSIEINVVTTDSENNTYHSLDSYFTISTEIGSIEEGIVSGSGTGGVDFDITKVTAEIITLY